MEMSDPSPSELKIAVIRYSGELIEHFNMAERIEKATSDDLFVSTVAQASITGFRAIFAKDTKRQSNQIWEDALVKIETEKARSYPKVIANQTLVLMCTTLDIYLQTSLEIILKSDPTSLHALCDDKDITVHEVIEFSGSDGAVTQIRSKILERFDYAGIRDKVRILRKCNIDMDKVLTGGSHWRKKYTSAEGMKLLLDTYQNRHDIVHKGALPFASSTDLLRHYNYFNSFIFGFAEVCSRDKGIPSDLTNLSRSKSAPPTQKFLRT